MKKLNFTLLPVIIFTISFTLSVPEQEYCNYNEQTTYDFGSHSFDTPYLMLEQNNGKTLIIGTSYYNSSNHFEASLLRLNQNNTPDETFGENGQVGHTWDQRNNCISGALQDDGKILIGGYQAPGNGVSTFRPYVARLMSDGSPDLSFGVDGSALLEFVTGIKGSVVGIKEMENGKIQAIVIGSNPGGYGLIQLDEFGAYDSNFSEDGVAYNPVTNVYWQTEYGNGLFLEDGSVIVVGKAFPGITMPCITKLTPEGDLDSTFAVDGTLYIERDIQYNFAGIHAALTNDEDIVIAATSDETPKKYLLFKVNGQTGELETDFGVVGTLESSHTSSFNAVNELVVDPATGGLYVMGTGGTSNWTPNIWKVSSMGEEENNCGGSSMQTFSLGYAYSQYYHAALFTSTGDLRISGNSGVADTTSGDNQVMNFMIPRNSLATGIKDIEDISFEVYPNPAVNEINISVEGNTHIDVVNIFNQMGQKVLGQEENNLKSTIDISMLPKGIYIIELQSTKTTLRKKIIVN